jgi:hypothetical protein
MAGSAVNPIFVYMVPRQTTSTVIDNLTFSGTVTSGTIDVSKYESFVVTYVTGAKTNSPSLVISLKVLDSNSNAITDPDYVTLPITTSTSGIAFKGFLEAYSNIQIVCSFSGTGSFAGTTVEIQMKS